MNSFCWPRLLTFCRVFCCSVCLCCLCMCSSVWHVKVTDELRFCVIYQPFLEVQSQWCATKRDIKCKKKCRKHFCFVFMHVLTHISSFCVLAASTGVPVCTWFNIFPLKYFHGSNCTHVFTLTTKAYFLCSAQMFAESVPDWKLSSLCYKSWINIRWLRRRPARHIHQEVWIHL